MNNMNNMNDITQPLPSEKYIQAINLTQLVSIDLIVLDKESSVLVGKRKNDPAKNMWFVPGGRIYKHEPWKEAIKRISRGELGYEIEYKDCTMIGLFDHHYPNNFLNRTDENGNMITTHYFVVGMQITVSESVVNKTTFEGQHSEIRWMPLDELMSRNDVHQNTKNYFL